MFVVNGRYRKLHDRLFIGCVTCGVLSYLTLMHALVEGTASYLFILLDNMETLVGLSICPMLFLYMRSVVREAKWRRWYGWLFVPAVVITLAGTTLSCLVGWDRILDIRIDGYHPFVPAGDSFVERFYYIVNIQLFDITLEVMAAVMIGLGINHFIKYKRKAELYYSNIEDASIGKIHRFLVSTLLSLVLLFSLTFFIEDILGESKIFLLCISLTFSTLLWIMSKSAYGIMVVEESLEIIDTLAEADNGDEAEKVADNDVIGQKLACWIDMPDKPYCREGITLADVAKAIQVNPRVMSSYINLNKQMNFRHWMNTLRIAEAKRMIEANHNEKLTYIAAVCGFCRSCFVFQGLPHD